MKNLCGFYGGTFLYPEYRLVTGPGFKVKPFAKVSLEMPQS